mmetsp:Transcript_39885/g.126841  ORF Transcript_39885/g.126841 Transcript_39885/m.126841 type:complete len:229 (+) Transcript_39885:336-1022(+)
MCAASRRRCASLVGACAAGGCPPATAAETEGPEKNAPAAPCTAVLAQPGSPAREWSAWLHPGAHVIHVGCHWSPPGAVTAVRPVKHEEPAIAGHAGFDARLQGCQECLQRPSMRNQDDGPTLEGVCDKVEKCPHPLRKLLLRFEMPPPERERREREVRLVRGVCPCWQSLHLQQALRQQQPAGRLPRRRLQPLWGHVDADAAAVRPAPVAVGAGHTPGAVEVFTEALR